MNTCDTCKWWVKFDNTWVEKVRHLGNCSNLHSGSYDQDGFVSMTEDADNISTGPKFGCIHHEPL